MATFDLPLPEITVKEFPRHGLGLNLYLLQRIGQASILPTLLRGKLVDYYVHLDAATKAD